METEILDKEAEKAIQVKADLAFYYESLAYSVDSADGQKILTELRSVLNDINSQLFTISMQDLPAPYYEHPKENLQLMKALRAKKEILSSVINGFDSQILFAASKRLKDEIESLKKGEPITPAY